MFLKEYPQMLYTIEQAIQSNDNITLQAPLVSIKSLISNFSVKSALSAIAKLEAIALYGDLTNAHEPLDTLKIEIEQIKQVLMDIVSKNK